MRVNIPGFQPRDDVERSIVQGSAITVVAVVALRLVFGLMTI